MLIRREVLSVGRWRLQQFDYGGAARVRTLLPVPYFDLSRTTIMRKWKFGRASALLSCPVVSQPNLFLNEIQLYVYNILDLVYHTFSAYCKMICNVLFVVVAVFYGAVAGVSQNITAETIIKFGPLSLAVYSDVGSQEVVYVQIPAAYLSKFAFQWSVGITTKDGSSADSCPRVEATILIRKWGIPIPNPKGASFPPNTWMIDNDITMASFWITETLPDKEKFLMIFSDDANSTGDFYISSFLIAEIENGTSSDETIPGNCKYMVQLSVFAYSDIPYDVAAIGSTNQLQTLSANNFKTDYSLERYRTGILSTDYVTDNDGYNISLNTSMKFSWIVEPYTDVGGTLKIRMGFHANDSLNGTMILRGCAARSIGETSSYDNCGSGDEISVNSSEGKSDVWYWPFPKSGIWVLDIGIECINGSCDFLNTVDIDISIIQCIESCYSSNAQGDCTIYRTDVLFFSACDCKGGWQGIACTDSSDAVPRSRQLLMTLLLTLSNLIFFPCGVVAIIKRYYSESVVYFFVMFFSTFYHACDNDFVIALCIIPYNVLQYSDFYGSITAMWVTLIAVAKLPFRLESFFHVLGISAIGVAVTYNRFSVFTTLIPVLCGLFILSLKWGKECRSTHACYPKKSDWLFSIIPGVLCAIVGFILFAFVETSENYFYVHSMWHILMGCAVLFLLPKEKKFSWRNSEDLFSSTEGDSGTNYNVYVNDTTAVHLELSDQSDESG